jgi:prepilin-type N-terminal cleavage/methylation domain-containing protein
MEVSSRNTVRALLVSPRMRRGFTLLEVMVVVAIIGVVMALAGTVTERSQRRARMHDAARQFRTRLEHARTLAQAAGPLLGTPRFVNCATGLGPGGNALAVNVDPGLNSYQLPVSLRFNNITGNMESICQTYTVGDFTESRGMALITVNGAAAPMPFAFSPNGRPVAAPAGPAVPAIGMFVRFEDSLGGETARGYGFRVLPSGVICSASDPAAAACDGDI